jgi:ribosomal protein S18 acetylase RimI-like enzyme
VTGSIRAAASIKMTDPTICRLESADSAALAKALPGFPCKPLDFWEAAARENQDRYWLDDIQAALPDPGCTAVAARSGDTIVGFAISVDQEWESRVIGRRICAIKHLAVNPDAPAQTAARLAARLCEEARSRGVECLTAKVHSMDTHAIHALERHQFRLMDTVLDFTFDYHRSPLGQIRAPRLPEGAGIGPATAADEEGLVEVARNAFGGHFGRFHADERIPGEKAKLVYEEWVRSSLRGWADFIAVCRFGDRVAGYSMWKRPSLKEAGHGFHLGHYSIAGIHPDYFGRGLFSALTYAGMRTLPELGKVDRIEGPTHVNNYPVHRGYLNLGWRITGARHTFHCWLDETA